MAPTPFHPTVAGDIDLNIILLKKNERVCMYASTQVYPIYTTTHEGVHGRVMLRFQDTKKAAAKRARMSRDKGMTLMPLIAPIIRNRGMTKPSSLLGEVLFVFVAFTRHRGHLRGICRRRR